MPRPAPSSTRSSDASTTADDAAEGRGPAARRSCSPRSPRSSASAWPPYASPTSPPPWASAPAWSSTTSAPRTSWSRRRSPTPWSATSRPWTGRRRGVAACSTACAPCCAATGRPAAPPAGGCGSTAGRSRQHEPVIAAHFRRPGGPQPPHPAGARRRGAGRRQHRCPDPDASVSRLLALLDGLSVAAEVLGSVSRAQLRRWLDGAIATELGGTDRRSRSLGSHLEPSVVRLLSMS